MFDQQDQSPTATQPDKWYNSTAVLVAASIILPPVGLVLLWTRRDIAAQTKIAGSLAVAVLAVGYTFLILGPVGRMREESSQYDALERHRAEQKRLDDANAAATANGGQATAPAAAVVTDPNAASNAQQPGAPGAVVTDPAAATQPQGATPNAAQQSASAPAPKSSRNYWTNFRGPSRDGRYDERRVKTTWAPEGLPLLWKQPAGGGFASFAVADGVAYTVEQRRGQEVVAAYNTGNGRELWTHGWNAEFRDSTGDGPRSTPTWDEGKLYALGGAGELRCLDAKTGKQIWARNILSDNGASNLQWGMAASPLIVDDKVIVQPGGSGKSIVAYNKTTGAPVWKVLSDQASYTSPMLVTLAGRRQILAVTAQRAVGLAPEDGALLWEYGWQNSASINVSQPIVVSPNRFFISAGYGKGAGLVEVAGSGKSFSASKVWENGTMKNKFNSSVYHDGHVYGLDEGILTCVDVATGERKWKGGRYGYGQVLLASGQLIISTDAGELVLVRAAPDKHTEVARFAALEGKTWNVPAIDNGRLLVRNTTEMACYNLAE